MTEPKTFKNQREAYWYRKGYEEAQQEINKMMDSSLEMYSSDLFDHLPTGEKESEEVVE